MDDMAFYPCRQVWDNDKRMSDTYGIDVAVAGIMPSHYEWLATDI